VQQRNRPEGTRKRLIQVMVAFPLAALIGLGGSLLVRTLWPEPPAGSAPSASPRPAGVDLDRHVPAQRT
jgi:hypothetical protein